ncbi:GNAT family N-acetyltransferase [Candidatus Neomarinimicrobiota bacterium]
MKLTYNASVSQLSDFPALVELKDGTPVLIRLLKPEDKEELRTGFEQLSMDSRRRRFLSSKGKLSNSHLKYLTEIDQFDHFALGAFDVGQETIKGIGVARYIRIENEPEVAEYAITILDTYQGRGLGTTLLGLLSKAARKNGICRFRGYVLEENNSMLSMLKRLGAHVQRGAGQVLRVDLVLMP